MPLVMSLDLVTWLGLEIKQYDNFQSTLLYPKYNFLIIIMILFEYASQNAKYKVLNHFSMNEPSFVWKRTNRTKSFLKETQKAAD